jgi:hypothetical protein
MNIKITKLAALFAVALLAVPGMTFAVTIGVTVPAGVSFTVSALSINSSGTTAFSWNIPAESSSPQPSFDVGPCIAGVTMYVLSATGRTPFLCGDLGRTISWGGSETLEFVNANTTPVQLSAYIENLPATLILQAPITVGSGPIPIKASSIAVAKNTSLGNVTAIRGTANVKIGSYTLTAPSSEAVNVSSLSIVIVPASLVPSPPTPGGNVFQNLKVLVNGVQFGATQSVVTNNGKYTFSTSPVAIPAGTSQTVDVYADMVSSAPAGATLSPATSFTGCAATGMASYSAYSCNLAAGQNLTFAGTSTITVTADAKNPPAGPIVQNSTGNVLGVFDFANSNTEAVKINALTVTDAVSSGAKPAFSNVGLWNGNTLLGIAQAPTAAGTGYVYAFTSLSLTNLLVPQGDAVTLTLKGDAGSYTSGSFTDGSTQTFSVSGGTAAGVTSNVAASFKFSGATANPMTMQRTVIVVSVNQIKNVPPLSLQDLGTLTLTANAAGDAVPASLKLTFGGNSVNSAFLQSIALKDPNGNNITFDGASVAVGSNAVTWTFNPQNTPLVVIAGSSYTLTLWGDLSKITQIATAAPTLSASIANAGDFTYYDGHSGSSPILVTLQQDQVPVAVTNLTFPVNHTAASAVTVSANPTNITAGQSAIIK